MEDFSLFTCSAEHEATCTLGHLKEEPSRYLESLLAHASTSRAFPLRKRSMSASSSSSWNGAAAGTAASSATYEWLVAGQHFRHKADQLAFAMEPLVDRYNTWASQHDVDALPDAMRHFEIVPALALKVVHASHGGRGAGGTSLGSAGAPHELAGRWRWAFQQVRANMLTIEVEPTNLVRDPAAYRAARGANGAVLADGGGDAASAVGGGTPYERALRSLEVAKLRMAFDVEWAEGGAALESSQAVLRCSLATTLRVELPHPWFVPRVAIEGPCNLLLKVGLKLACDGLLTSIHELHTGTTESVAQNR